MRHWIVTGGVVVVLGLVMMGGVACGGAATPPASGQPGPTAGGSGGPAQTGGATVNQAGEKTIYIGPELVDCTGVAPMKCMQYREIPAGPWLRLYGSIEGFTYTPGFIYELRIRETKVATPPADGSSIRRTLIQEVSRTPVATPSAPVTPAAPGATPAGLPGSAWTLVAFGDKTSPRPVVGAQPVTLEFRADGSAGGSAGCNRYTTSYTVTGDKLTIKPIGLTRMACPDSTVMEQETRYTQALEKAEQYALSANGLEILANGGQQILIFRQGQ